MPTHPRPLHAFVAGPIFVLAILCRLTHCFIVSLSFSFSPPPFPRRPRGQNFAFNLCQFWFNWWAMFSGQTVIDDWYISTYNLLFTGLPVMLYAVFDKVLSLGGCAEGGEGRRGDVRSCCLPLPRPCDRVSVCWYEWSERLPMLATAVPPWLARWPGEIDAQVHPPPLSGQCPTPSPHHHPTTMSHSQPPPPTTLLPSPRPSPFTRAGHFGACLPALPAALPCGHRTEGVQPAPVWPLVPGGRPPVGGPLLPPLHVVPLDVGP